MEYSVLVPPERQTNLRQFHHVGSKSTYFHVTFQGFLSKLACLVLLDGWIMASFEVAQDLHSPQLLVKKKSNENVDAARASAHLPFVCHTSGIGRCKKLQL